MNRRLSMLVVVVAVAACAPKKPVVEALKNEGEACSGDAQCSTGMCDAAPGFQTVCVRKCASVCKTGEVCTQLTANRFACQPDEKRLCQACNTDNDCPYPADKCLVVNGEKVCGRDCAFDQACPADYACVNAKGADGNSKVQQCVPKLASCACLARGDVNTPCEVSNANGTCTGVKTCDLVSNSVVCSAPTPVASECGVGECRRTVNSCGADGGVCMPGTPVAEVCNGKDDDCDGHIDNGFDLQHDLANCGVCGRVCSFAHAAPLCSSGECKLGACEAGFADCNGRADDGCEAAITGDVNNCGACGRVCTTTAGTTAACVNSQCQLACAPGYVDLDGNPANGCECHKTADTDLPDLPAGGAAGFVDANCDGIDGEVNNAIFVSSTTGDDGNDGSMAHPKKSLNGPQGAIITLAQSGKRDLYLATGSFTGPIELNFPPTNMTIAGGYDPVTWKRAISNVVTVQHGNPALKIDSASALNVQLVRFQGDDATGSSPGLSAYGAWVTDSTVTMGSVTITAGSGADGGVGASGVSGADGGAGGNSETAKVVDADPICSTVNNNHPPAVGAAGASSCGETGGQGGMSSHQNSTVPPSSSVVPGADGLASAGGTAGGKGVPEAITPFGPPYDGANGSAGADGADGVLAKQGTFTSTGGWWPGNGNNGADGKNGKGGGGGGGGAGGWEVFSLPYVASYSCQSYGSPGGGGGGGGCGGTGGKGGVGGGASVGLFVSNSTITGAGNFIYTGNGGNGAPGGAGSSGGAGGPGGTSPDPKNDLFDVSNATRGGKGGAGGKGGRGGAGSAGAGGSVFGVARSSRSNVSGFTVAPLGNAGSGTPSGQRAASTSF